MLVSLRASVKRLVDAPVRSRGVEIDDKFTRAGLGHPEVGPGQCCRSDWPLNAGLRGAASGHSAEAARHTLLCWGPADMHMTRSSGTTTLPDAGLVPRARPAVSIAADDSWA